MVEYITGGVLAQIKLSDPEPDTGNQFAYPVFPPGCHGWAAPHDIDWRSYLDGSTWKLRTKIMIFIVRVDKTEKQTWLDWDAQKKIVILGLNWPDIKAKLVEIKNKLDHWPCQKAGRIRWFLKTAIPSGWSVVTQLKRFAGFQGVDF